MVSTMLRSEIRSAIVDLLREHPCSLVSRDEASVDQLVDAAAMVFEVDPVDILHECRRQDVVFARALVVEELHARGWSNVQIGRHLAKDPTSILATLRQTESGFGGSIWYAYGRRKFCGYFNPPGTNSKDRNNCMGSNSAEAASEK
jgi:hypothetical protein